MLFRVRWVWFSCLLLGCLTSRQVTDPFDCLPRSVKWEQLFCRSTLKRKCQEVVVKCVHSFWHFNGHHGTSAFCLSRPYFRAKLGLSWIGKSVETVRNSLRNWREWVPIMDRVPPGFAQIIEERNWRRGILGMVTRERDWTLTTSKKGENALPCSVLRRTVTFSAWTLNNYGWLTGRGML